MPFDPASDSLPESLADGPLDAVVLLLDAAENGAWAADSAVALAAAWARAGRRIVLADLHLEEPILHEGVGEGNLDGVVDIFLYGASLARSARPVPGRGFYLIPAGTYTADARAVFEHPRWAKLVVGFREAHASLLLFVRGAAPGLASLAQWSEQLVVLGAHDRVDLLPAPFLSGKRVQAVLVPPFRREADAASGARETGLEIRVVRAAPEKVEPEQPELPKPGAPKAESDFPDPAEQEAGGPILRVPPMVLEAPSRTEIPSPNDATIPFPAARTPAAAPTVPFPSPPSTPAPEIERTQWIEPAPPINLERQTPRRRRGRRVPTLAWVLAGLVGLAVAGYLLASTRSGGLGGTDSSSQAGGTSDPLAAEPAASVPAVAAGVPLTYAVQVKAFTSLDAARQQMAVEERRFTDAPFYVSPERIAGILYYKVLAGFPADSAAATMLRERLVDVGSIDPADAAGSWSLIQYAPLAFQLGEYATRDSAATRADSMLARGLPVYLVAVPFSDGSERWRLYGGAFRDSSRAEGMRELLARAGVQAPLRERVGSPATAQ